MRKEYLENTPPTQGRDKQLDTFKKKQEFEGGRDIVYGKRKGTLRKQKA